MARLSQGILGGISGRIGNVVGSSWKGIAVIKSKALSVANPRTAAQVAQRDKMTSIVDVAKFILAGVIKPLNDRFASGMSGFNLFVSRNIHLFSGSTPFPPADLILSSGKMSSIVLSSAVADLSDSSITVNWPTALSDAYAQASDKVYAIAITQNGGVHVLASGNFMRSAGTLVKSGVTDLVLGESVWVYLSFLRSDGTVVSNTCYLATTVTA